MRIHLIFLLLLVGSVSESVLGQRHTISGFIRDEGSNEQLIGANVYESSSLNGTISNFYGFYSLSLSSGDVNFFVPILAMRISSMNLSLARTQ